MAFDRSQLLQRDEGLWVYEGTDAPATVIAAGFIPAGYGVKLGDIVIIKQFATSAKLALTALIIAHVTAVASTGLTLAQTAT